MNSELHMIDLRTIIGPMATEKPTVQKGRQWNKGNECWLPSEAGMGQQTPGCCTVGFPPE